MQTILIVIHVFLATGLIGLILMQHGKGADAGAAFGSGASSTVFGSQGSANFLSRTTGVLAAGFFITSLAMGWFSMQATKSGAGLMEGMEQAAEQVPVDLELPTPPEIPGTAGDSELPQVEAPQPVNDSSLPVTADPAPTEVEAADPIDAGEESPDPAIETDSAGSTPELAPEESENRAE